MDSKPSPHVVVIGAGFGGLLATRTLARYPVRVTLIDRKNFHTFQPLLYQVATAGLSPGEIAAPIRWILSGYRNVQVLLGEVQDFDLARKIVKLRDGDISYDYLIVAAGASHAYFGHDEWEPLAPGLKTVEDAIEIRRRVLLAFELAERDAAETGRHSPLNFVVVGGGPTGVELAGTLAEIARHVLKNEFHSIDPQHTRIVLLEGGPRILPAYPEDLSRSAEAQLRHLGVEVQTSAVVTGMQPAAVLIGKTRLPAAVAQFGKIHISGFLAWLAWLFIHIFFLIGFRNRLIVMIQWAWSYLTYERGARLITGDTSLPSWDELKAEQARAEREKVSA